MNSKVSVIIPVYNSEEFLRDSIESVINQTYSDIEIIAINDGSTDGSLKILKQYENKIIIINQKNMGLAEAVNAGIKKMSGNWLKWLSPDDILLSNAIQILVKEAKKLSQNTILYSDWEIINQKGKKLRNFHESDYNHLDVFDFNIRLLDGQQINVNTTLIPSLLFEKGCKINDLKNPIAIDYDFFLRAGILYETKFHLIRKPLIKYRIHQNQLSHRNILQSLSYLDVVRENILSQLENTKSHQYQNALKDFSSKKPLGKKTMELGLKLASKILPKNITDDLLVFYLNSIRKGR